MLLPHNVKVYNELEQTLLNDNCCCVVMGTGVGKTYVTSEFLDNHNYKALVVSPRASINKSWEKHTKRVETVTYQKLANIYKDIDYSFYDVVICDEVHHIGAPRWGKPIKYLIDKGVRVIGLTEDSVRYSDGARDVAKEFFHGNIAKGEDVKSAIRKEILNPVTYVGAMYNSDGLKKTLRGKIQSRLYAKLNLVLNKTPTVYEILKKNMPEGKRKGIIFASTIEDIKSAMEFVKSVYPNVDVRFVHSKRPVSYNNEVFEWFKNTDEGYICSVDMISEGVHIKGVNTLIMLRRTESVNLFNQQLGRCLNASTREPAILFDLVNNQYSIKVINNRVQIKTNSIATSGKLNIVPSEQLIIKDYTKDIVDVLFEIKRNLDNRYTDDEIKLLYDFYQENPHGNGLKAWAKKYLPNHSYRSVTGKASKLGFKAGQDGLYTEEEINFICEQFPEHGAKYVADQLGRDVKSVAAKASSLGVTTNKYKNNWSDKEIKIVKKYYPTEGFKVLKRLPGVSLNSLQSFLSKNDIKMVKQVCCVETGVIYKSALAARKALSGNNNFKKANSITECCKGKRKTAYGYHWRYVE